MVNVYLNSNGKAVSRVTHLGLHSPDEEVGLHAALSVHLSLKQPDADPKSDLIQITCKNCKMCANETEIESLEQLGKVKVDENADSDEEDTPRADGLPKNTGLICGACDVPMVFKTKNEEADSENGTEADTSSSSSAPETKKKPKREGAAVRAGQWATVTAVVKPSEGKLVTYIDGEVCQVSEELDPSDLRLQHKITVFGGGKVAFSKGGDCRQLLIHNTALSDKDVQGVFVEMVSANPAVMKPLKCFQANVRGYLTRSKVPEGSGFKAEFLSVERNRERRKQIVRYSRCQRKTFQSWSCGRAGACGSSCCYSCCGGRENELNSSNCWLKKGNHYCEPCIKELIRAEK